jgi:hypothetical protein
VSFDCPAERSDLIFFVRRGHRNAQSRGAFCHCRTTNRRDEESFSFECSGQIKRRLLIANEQRKDRASFI